MYTIEQSKGLGILMKESIQFL